MIYFIKEYDKVKIGFSESKPKERLSQLQTGNAYELTMIFLMEGDRDDEVWLHELFSDHAIRGEWFRLDREIIEYIESRYDDDIRYEYGLIDKEIDPKIQTRLIRKNAGLKLRQVGEKLGITAQSVKETEMRELHGGVSINRLRAYGEALGYELQYKFIKP